MSSDLSRARAITRYRRLVRDYSILAHVVSKPAFQPFAVFLVDFDGGHYDFGIEGWADCLRHDACKDRAVEKIRDLAKNENDESTTIAVWFAAPGWSAPDDGTRPSQHKKRRRVVMVVESTLHGDVVWIRERERWTKTTPDPGDRFADLIGREKHVGPLRVVSKE